MFSRIAVVRAGTLSQVRFRRCIGAAPKAEIIDVKVEKLFSCRHFYIITISNLCISVGVGLYPKAKYLSHSNEVFDDNNSPFDLNLGKNHFCNPICELIGV